jgi:hypothetical protein
MDIQSASAFMASRNSVIRSATRDSMEGLLKFMTGQSTDYGRKVSGFAEFLNDEKVQALYAHYISENSVNSDGLYASMNWDQKGAYWALRDADRMSKPEHDHDGRRVPSDTISEAENNTSALNHAHGRMEHLLKSANTYLSADSGKRVDDFAPFMDDETVQAAFAQYLSGGGIDSALYSSMNDDQKKAIDSLIEADRRTLPGSISGVQREAAITSPVTMSRVHQAYGLNVAPRRYGADAVTEANFNSSLSLGGALLRTVDREIRAGKSNMTWEDAFSHAVTSLDRSYQEYAGSFPMGSDERNQITARYEKQLTDLIDYAKARGEGRA